ncbi:hypothetical protein B0H19DRAFT_1284375 [Mycena capillaripes]|nr:hypothetical protein B0H19DRAFT_1284375 [Mycena capillaripes]
MPPASPPPVYELLSQYRRSNVDSEVHVPPPQAASSNESNGPQRVQELWFEDGNIIIQAGNSLYRVYRGPLATRSSVLRDIVEGCPFVEFPDPEVEVTPFLRAIFEPEFFLPFPSPTEFDIVIGCLRLSHKYKVGYLRRRALVHFSSGYPTKLSQFDTHNRYRPGQNPSELEKPSWKWPEDAIYRVRALQIAREVDAPWILPRVFYALSCNFHKLGVALFHGAVYKGVDARLSLQDQISFLRGFDIQRRATATDILRFLSQPLDTRACRHPHKCDSDRLKAIEVTSREFLPDHAYNPLYIWVSTDWDLLRNLCLPCNSTLKAAHQNARQEFWDHLPEIYDLASWEVLEQMKTAALDLSRVVVKGDWPTHCPTPLMTPLSPPPVYESLLHYNRSEAHELPPASPPISDGPNEPQRVQELWFEDGNIIIQAGNSLYRVYRGPLATRSSVLRNIVEGCPFVEFPDPEVEVTPFLRAIFEPDHKYKVGYLRRRALVHFSSGYPTKLSQFDTHNRYRPGQNPSELQKPSWKLPEDLTSRIRALQIAREIDAPWILPRAFYTLSLNFCLGPAIFHGTVYKGFNIQRKATAMDILRFLSHPLDITGCHHPARCGLERLKAMESISRELLPDYADNPLYIWLWADWSLLRNLCPPCDSVLKNAHQNARQAFWDRLPEIYDLAPWDILEQMKTAALDPSRG